MAAHIPVADHELLIQVVREAVESHFGLRVERVERTERVYTLTALPNLSPQLQPAVNGENWMSGDGQGSIIGTAQSMEDIARAFEGLLNHPVIDGTGVKGKFNYSASTKLPESEAAFDLGGSLSCSWKKTVCRDCAELSGRVQVCARSARRCLLQRRESA